MTKRHKPKKNETIFKKIKDLWALIFFCGIAFYFLFILVRSKLKEHWLKSDSKEVKAVVIDEENYWGNSPVSQTFSYSYEFKVNEKKYRGDTHDENARIGDSVLIEYVKFFPSFNRIVRKDK